MAMLINRLTRFAGLVQAIFFIPNILPIAVMAMIGGWMLHPTFGWSANSTSKCNSRLKIRLFSEVRQNHLWLFKSQAFARA